MCLSLVASPFGREYFIKTGAAIIVFPRASFPVIKNNITQVLASDFEKTETTNKLLTKYTGSQFPYRELQDSKDQIVLKTSRLVANVRSPTLVGTGAVLFSDNTGKPPLHEQPVNTHRFRQRNETVMFYKSNGIFINSKPVPRRSK
jgi:hypothetical protein